MTVLATTLFALALGSFSLRTNTLGQTFLDEKKKEKDVITLPSGLEYKVLERGSGKFHPAADSPCSVDYEGTLIDGTKFDSSYDRGESATFAPNQVIPGWTEAMQSMVEGDKWEMYIPSDLAYGSSGTGPIPPDSALIFKMQLHSIQGDKVPLGQKARLEETEPLGEEA